MLSLFLPQPSRRRASVSWIDDPRLWGIGNGGPTVAGVAVDEEVALTYAACFCATRVLAEGVAGLPIFLYQRMPNDDRRFANLPVADKLRVSPNPDMTASPFREGRTAHQVNWGNGFSEIDLISDPGNVTLWPIHPSRVSESREARFDYEIRNSKGPPTGLLAEQVLHITGCLSDGGRWGRGVIQAARETIGFGITTERHGAAYFGSGGQPKGLVVADFANDPESRREFRRDWREMHGDPNNKEIAVLPAGSSYTPYGYSNEDSQFLETRGATKNEIATWYRIPSYMLNIHSGETKGNVEQQGLEFVIYSLYPWVRKQEEAYNFKLLTRQQRADGYYFEHQFAALLRGDITARMNAYRLAIMTGIMTINECRRLENLNGIGPDGDKNYMPVNMATVDAISTGATSGDKGPGSDQSGSPADVEAKFAEWQRQLPKIESQEVAKQVRTLEIELPERKLELREAARLVLIDAMARILAREANAAQKAAKSNEDFDRWLQTFHNEHAELFAEVLTPACSVVRMIGVRDLAAPANLAAWMRARSTEDLHAAYNRDARETFANKLRAWSGERAARLADAVLATAV